MMELDLILYGIARDIVGKGKLTINIETGASIQELKRKLTTEFPKMTDLNSISFAVDTEYVDDTYQLKDHEEVVIIPPVSGG